MIEIVAARTEDFKTIQAIAQTTWPEAYGAILSKEQMHYMLDSFYAIDKMEADSQNGHFFALAKENRAVLGFVSFEHHHPYKESTKIHKLYLLPHSQGKGVGKLLVDYVAHKAKKQHFRSICLNVNRFNKALGFYQKIGFSIIREENIEIGKGYLMEDYVLEKMI